MSEDITEDPVLTTERPDDSSPDLASTPSPEQPSPPPAIPAKRQIPAQRWQIFPAQKSQAYHIAEATGLSPLLAQVLINRGIHTPEQAQAFLDPETLLLPSPLDDFPDLTKSLDILTYAIDIKQKVLICGDYDADGMTSTALLMRSLRYLGGQVNYAIPSRMDEGYGINLRMVEEFHAAGGSIIITVDNGIAAYDAIARAKELGLIVILTDHHDVPEQIPPADAILNPKLIRESSPYRGIAGVGVAYILAVCLAQRLDKMQDLTATLLALFTLGTIADLAPLTGVNRRWVKRGLQLLPTSRIPGIQALIEVAGLSDETDLRPEAIGFRLGPRINAVGRIADPQIVIDLLTTDDIGVALQRAMQCEETNQLRRQMCEIIETQAVEWCEEQIESGQLDLAKERVLVVIQPEWHHGVIGIVASRLVERYGVTVFIGTYEDKSKKEIRGSARSIPEFNVFEALQFCDDLLDKYGGHRAAGGFSFHANKLRQVKSRLSNFARQHLQPEHLKPLVTVDVQAPFTELGLDLYTQIDQLHPCGIENPDPIFWSANTTVVDQKVIGKTSDHLKLTLAHTTPGDDKQVVIKAIAWRWGRYHPLPQSLDIAYKLRLNEWRGRRTVELELVGVRPAKSAQTSPSSYSVPSAREVARNLQHEISGTSQTNSSLVSAPEAPKIEIPQLEVLEPKTLDVTTPEANASLDSPILFNLPPKLPKINPDTAVRVPTLTPPTTQSGVNSLHVEFYYSKRRYKGTLENAESDRHLTIENSDGHLLIVQLQQRQGFLYLPDKPAQVIDISELRYFNLIRAGLSALEVKQKTQTLIRQEELLNHQEKLITDKDRQISTLKAQIELLEEKITQLSSEQQQQFEELKSEIRQQESAIQGQEAHIEQLQVQVSTVPPQTGPMPTPEEIKQQVRDAIGDGVWFCLQTASQNDLLTAYKNEQIVYASSPDANIADYSEAGIRLSATIEREVLTPFFQSLSPFLQRQSISQIGDIALGATHQYTLSMLPPLLADQWRSVRAGQLSARELPEGGMKMVKAKAAKKLSERDRTLLNQFFSQWEHPMATCLSEKGRQAASSLDQISKLRNIATHSESFLYRWQYELLRKLIAGEHGRGGLLRQLFVLS